MMLLFDQILTKAISQIGQTLPAATVNTIAECQRDRSAYILKVLAAPVAIQFAVRDAAIAGGTTRELQIAALLNKWLYPASMNPNGDGPFIAPLSNPTIGQFNLTFPGSWSGKDLRFEIGNTSAGATPDVSPSSSIWPTGPTSGVRFSASQVPVFVKARYFVGSNPVSNQSLAAYRIDISINGSDKDAFITAFKRRSAIMGGTRWVNNGHVWPPQLIP